MGISTSPWMEIWAVTLFALAESGVARSEKIKAQPLTSSAIHGMWWAVHCLSSSEQLG